MGGEPAAFSVSYLPAQLEALVGEFAAATSPTGPPPHYGRPCAFQVDFAPPAPSVARTLRLAPGEPAATVTVRFEDAARRKVIALTVAVLRPDLFRIVVESPGIPAPTVSPEGPPRILDTRGAGLATLTRDACSCNDFSTLRSRPRAAAAPVPDPEGHPATR